MTRELKSKYVQQLLLGLLLLGEKNGYFDKSCVNFPCPQKSLIMLWEE